MPQRVGRQACWRPTLRAIRSNCPCFVGLFAAVAVTASNQPEVAQEWARLLVVTIAIVIYRPLDGWFMRRL